MPIRASQRMLYPPNWREISQQARERARNRCEDCGVISLLGGPRGIRINKRGLTSPKGVKP